jgi:hypothetical protein
MALRELISQYAHMEQIFRATHRLLGNCGDDGRKRRLLRDLGEAALQENAQWILRQRERSQPGHEAMSA